MPCFDHNAAAAGGGLPAAIGFSTGEAGRAGRFSRGWEATREDWARWLEGLRKVRDGMMETNKV